MAPRISTEVSAEDFLTAYFRAKGILKCCFTVYPYHIGLQEQGQALRELGDLDRKLLQLCWGLFGPSVSGQFSLRRKCQRVIVGRIGINYRPANQFEAAEDYDMFGDQVVGDKIIGDLKEKGHAVLSLWGTEYMFAGPLRFKSLACPLICEEGGLPTADQITKLIPELDREATNERFIPGGQQILACYFVLHAANGQMLLAPFKKVEEYDPQKAKNIGEVEEGFGQLIFYPEGDRRAGIDYTEHLFRG
ncbi:MAG: hypothetical protein A3J76_01835 [Candidatus Moranbacteria bacterium RBG_13_45_13]|nr:MAG: hypothetical protein A3J76_01835 [Candidatus Moranbacteria bacterium RBG_13_45_13]